MTKPVLLTVDDDPEVLRVLGRDLQQQYGANFRILHANSGEKALGVIKRLKIRNEPVALVIADQRMPQMTGVEFLEQAMALLPDTRRVLLTAYADTDTAIKAINLVKIDYYLLKPWDPPEEYLFPALQDLLNDWMATYRPLFQEIRVLGYQWSARSHDVKSFLARNQIPYRALDIESSQEARILIEHVGLDVSQMPIVLFPDGTQLYQPSHAQVAEKVGLKTHAEKPFYDLAIVGAGPAGLAAAVYGASEGLRTVLIEREASGGQAGTSSRIENYLGFPVGLSGGDLARRAVAQASRFGVEILLPQEASEIVIRGPYRCIKLTDGTEIACHTLIIATGVSYRLLDIPGMERLSGAGVYYGAAMNEALACRGQDIYIVGGANSAGQAAIYFSKFARRVTLLVRADSLSKSMSQYLVDQISLIPNIEVRTHVNVTEVRGKEHLEMICITNAETGEEELLPAFALFIFIGAEPHTEWLSGTLARDKHGFILTGSDVSNSRQDWSLNRPPSLLESSIPGVFVAGDVRHGSIKRVASGVGEGSIAVQLVHQYLREVK